MLKANVGLSRKVSENFQSSGYSLNLEGEIQATLDDPDAVIERIKELFSVADEALDRQISESRSIDSLARRDADDAPGHPSNGKANAHHPIEAGVAPPSREAGHRDANPALGDPATNKQVSFLITLAKRRKLQDAKLESFIEESIGRRCSPYDLNKKEAGTVIDVLNPEEAAEKNRARR